MLKNSQLKYCISLYKLVGHLKTMDTLILRTWMLHVSLKTAAL